MYSNINCFSEMISSDDDLPLANLTCGKRFYSAETSDDDIPLAKVARKNRLGDVLRESKKSHNRCLEIDKLHTKLVDKLLHANNCKRIVVPSDGDCLFTAVLKSCSEYSRSQEQIILLRKKVCDHLLQHSKEYRPFLTNNVNFNKAIRKLRKQGKWIADLADALPMAFSNIFQVEIIIFTSVNTVLDVVPCMKIEPDSEIQAVCKKIILAHLRIPGREHYDAVICELIILIFTEPHCIFFSLISC